MYEVYGYVPAWDLPDISPYVTKLIFYMKMAKIPYEYKNQDLTKLDVDAPFGKLPYIIDKENGTKVADTNTIIAYLQKKHGDPFDKDLSKAELASQVAWDRLIGEHLYYSGILEPRWRLDSGWETYIPYIVQGAEVGPDLRAMLDAFRVRILDGFKGQGMGRRDGATVLDFFHTDVDAISDFMGDKPYFFGNKVHTIDACCYAILRHLADQPQKWDGTGYVQSKKNLAGYLERMRNEYKM